VWLDEDNKKNEESEDEEEVEAECQNLVKKDVSTHYYGCKLNQRRIGVLIRQVEEKGQHWSPGS